MIYKVGGYSITFEQAKAWIALNDVRWRGSVLTGAGDVLTKLRDTSTDPAASWYRVMCTDFPRRTPHHEGVPVIVFGTTHNYEHHATVDQYTQFEETDRYRTVKQFLEKSGLEGQLTFVTVPDPYYWYKAPAPEDRDIMYL
jgi:hypothetical protein